MARAGPSRDVEWASGPAAGVSVSGPPRDVRAVARLAGANQEVWNGNSGGGVGAGPPPECWR